MNKNNYILQRIISIYLVFIILNFSFLGLTKINNFEKINNTIVCINNSNQNNNYHNNIKVKNKITSRSGSRYPQGKQYKYYKISVYNYDLYFETESEALKVKEIFENINDEINVNINYVTYNIKENIENNDNKINIIKQYLLKTSDKSYYPTISKNISSNFGYRISPTKGIYAMHKGIDISANYGDEVFSYKNGIVIFAGFDNSGYGNMILIKHADGTETRYAHLSQILISVGQNVKGGNIIGKVGSTGSSTGNHLHFEVIINGINVNPYSYIF